VSRCLELGRTLVLTVQDKARCEPDWLDKPNIHLVETGPLEHCESLEEAMRDVSDIVHLAGLAHVIGPHDRRISLDAFMAANERTTAKLVDAALEVGTVKTFIYLSSIAAIAENSANHVVSDNSPQMPVTPYGQSKRAAELHLDRLTQRGILAVALRPPLIFGPTAKGNWARLLRLSRSGLPLPFGAALNRRSMISVDTMTEVIVHLTSRSWSSAKSGSYCVADSGTISLARIIAELRRGMNIPNRMFAFPAPVLYGLARLAMSKRRVAGLLGDLEVDGARFNDTFGFEPSQTLCQSVYLCGVECRATPDSLKAN
jgi:nucleoside-diphosphate-sugar epimerase